MAVICAYVYVSHLITREISSANIAFGSANIQRYYTVQQLIAQLSSASGETTVTVAKGTVVTVTKGTGWPHRGHPETLSRLGEFQHPPSLSEETSHHLCT